MFKNNARRFFLILSLCIFSVPCYAAEIDTIQRLEKMLENLRSVDADFHQTILDGKGKVIQQTKGQMALQRPGKFRWDTLQPSRQLIVTNGQKVWIYDQDLEQVTVQSLNKSMGNAPAMLLLGNTASLSKNFSISSPVASEASEQWFILKPKDKQSLFAKLKLHFSDNQLDEMQLIDSLGHITLIKFSNVRVNQKISVSQFNFVPPQGVDVIQN